MSVLINIPWWAVPTAITAIGLIWAICIVKPGSGIGAGLSNLLALGLVSAWSAVAWAIFGFIK